MLAKHSAIELHPQTSLFRDSLTKLPRLALNFCVVGKSFPFPDGKVHSTRKGLKLSL